MKGAISFVIAYARGFFGGCHYYELKISKVRAVAVYRERKNRAIRARRQVDVHQSHPNCISGNRMLECGAAVCLAKDLERLFDTADVVSGQ
jgi:hypothetical protein